MLLRGNTCLLVFLFCSLALWCKSTSAGSSFLSPSQKPQSKGKSPRASRQLMDEPGRPTEDKDITISAPFEIGVTMRGEEFAEYGVVLQEIIQHLMGNAETGGSSSSA